MIYAAWGSDGRAHTLVEGEHQPRFADGSLQPDCEQLIWRIEADSWEDARFKYNQLQGWEAVPRRRSRWWLAVWLVVSFVLGIGCSFIPWGSPSTFHGIGFPVFIVAWQRTPPTGEFLDYPNPLGFVLNPALVFLTGIIVWILFRIVVLVYSRIAKRR